ncbi:Hypothetical predicted protein [Olea europaea subsp. europaea]|uniref:Uncharacterized protein n=1 Tax=Olea europaea subsp. europaea TaxID=158383 RepID=A0A8S0RP82_OLEEU|nr:Hypothetical predicted protein [Olea europaea subsp. europaea]
MGNEATRVTIYIQKPRSFARMIRSRNAIASTLNCDHHNHEFIRITALELIQPPLQRQCLILVHHTTQLQSPQIRLHSTHSAASKVASRGLQDLSRGIFRPTLLIFLSDLSNSHGVQPMRFVVPNKVIYSASDSFPTVELRSDHSK